GVVDAGDPDGGDHVDHVGAALDPAQAEHLRDRGGTDRGHRVDDPPRVRARPDDQSRPRRRGGFGGEVHLGEFGGVEDPAGNPVVDECAPEAFGRHGDNLLQGVLATVYRIARQADDVEAGEQDHPATRDQGQRTDERGVDVAGGPVDGPAPLDHHVDPLEEYPALVELACDGGEGEADTVEIRWFVATDPGVDEGAGGEL